MTIAAVLHPAIVPRRVIVDDNSAKVGLTPDRAECSTAVLASSCRAWFTLRGTVRPPGWLRDLLMLRIVELAGESW